MAVLGATGLVVNDRLIQGNTASSIGSAVYLDQGGRVTSRATGTIQGRDGVFVAGLAGTIVNAGILSGSSGAGANLRAGGTVTNQAGGTINGYRGVAIGTGAGVVTNAGTILSTGVGADATGIYMYDGGTVTNQASGLISGRSGVVLLGTANAVSNAGRILATGTGTLVTGVYVTGGTVTNQASATIAGQVAVGGGGVPTTVVNAGTVSGTGSDGVGVSLRQGGAVTNQAGGVITASRAVTITGAAGVVVNDGLIAGNLTATLGIGVYLGQGGSVTNSATGTIQGLIGIEALNAAATVVNAGTVTGGAAGAGVHLGAGGTLTNEATGLVTVVDANAGASIINAGRLFGVAGPFFGSASYSNGVDLDGGGLITNLASGVIKGWAGIVATNGDATISNVGTVIGDGSGFRANGIDLSGGHVTNQVGGHILGYSGVVVRENAGTIVNAGSIRVNDPTGDGVGLRAGGLVVNQSGARIDAGYGVRIGGQAGTLVNAGTIIGWSGTAVALAAGFSHHVTLAPGSVFDGIVDGGNELGSSPASTLHLDSAASAGTITALGTQFINFAQTTITAGAQWVMTGVNQVGAAGTITNLGTLTLNNASLTGGADLINNGFVILDPSLMEIGDLIGSGFVTIDAGSTLSVGGTADATATVDFIASSGMLQLDDPFGFDGLIGGFAPGILIDLPDAMVAESSTILAGNTLQIVIAGGGTIDLRLDPTETFEFQSIIVNGDEISISPPCFRAGTLIETTRGPVAVEALVAGDQVITAGPSGPGARPVTWIGHRAVACDRHPDPAKVWPVRVRADAFGEGMPNRDLWLSPDHAVFVDGVLVPVKHLIDGVAIVQEAAASVTYFHVELPLHDVLLAEGLPCESYLDSGDRANFDNGGAVIRLHPDFARTVWEAAGCAPLHVTGPVIEAVRVRLQGWSPTEAAQTRAG